MAAIGEDESCAVESAQATLLAKKLESIDVQGINCLTFTFDAAHAMQGRPTSLTSLPPASNAAGEIMQAANAEAKGIRAEFEAQIKAVSKKIRDMSVSSYLLSLVSPSKKDSDLGSMLSRLMSPIFKERVSSAAQKVLQNAADPPAEVALGKESDDAPPQEPARKKQKTSKPIAAAAAASNPVAENVEINEPAAAPVVSKRVTRANIVPAVASTPLPAASKGNGRGRKGKAGANAIPFPLATPSETPNRAAAASTALEAPSSAIMNTGGRLTGFSLTTRTAMRGRRGGASDVNENAICISTYDGQQFMVDGEAGLSNIPEQYREEVAQQLEVMQKLVVAALKFK